MVGSPNNFHFLRLSAAILVLVSHQYALLNMAQPATTPGMTTGALGVYTFFSISGYLVTKSWNSDPRTVPFVCKRVLRIWPGLIFTTLVCALLLGPIVSSLNVKDYFGSSEVIAFFSSLRLRIVYHLPGVFTENPYRGVVNGSLWTIPLEVKCYGILLILGASGLLKRRRLLLISTLGLAAFYSLWLGAPKISQTDHLMENGLYFCGGALIYLFRDWHQAGRLGLPVALGSLIALLFNNMEAALWLLIPFAVVSVGLASTPVLRHAGRYGDFSYGLYIFAFPAQQTVIWASDGSLNISVLMGLSLCVTLVCAFVSWHLVEAPALKLKLFTRPKIAPVSNARCSMPG